MLRGVAGAAPRSNPLRTRAPEPSIHGPRIQSPHEQGLQTSPTAKTPRPARTAASFSGPSPFSSLIGFAIGCWIFSFYTFGHPEKPMSYAILTKLKKLEDPKRFEITAAPQG